MRKVIKWIKSVAVGWWNVIIKNETPEAKRRYDICMNCDKKIKVGKDYVCSQCGCFLKAKSRSPEEKCVLNKWQYGSD